MKAWRADPLVWGHGPRIFEVFLEPTCPFSVRAFGKLEDLLDNLAQNLSREIVAARLRHRAAVCRAAAPASARTHFSGIDDGDGLDLDHKIGSGETGNADGRAGRGRHPEIAHADVGALLELVEIGDKGVGLDDV